MAYYLTVHKTKFHKTAIAICSALFISSMAMANQESLDTTSTVDSTFEQGSRVSYGPIKTTDTLWAIAVANRPDTSVSNYQVMMALFEHNPNAFLRNDVNTLVAGQFLRIPTLAEIKVIEPYKYPASNANNETKSKVAAKPAKVVEQVEQTESIPVFEESNSEFVAVDISNPQTNVDDIVNDQSAVETLSTPIAKVVEAQPPEFSESAQNSIAKEPLNSTPNKLSIIENENLALKESLSAVDEQLSALQYEVAKASEKQNEVDTLLAEQKALLATAARLEKRLLEQQKRLDEEKGILNSPTSHWVTNGVLAVLVLVLFFLVNRRRQNNGVSNTPATAPEKNSSNESKRIIDQIKVSEIVKKHETKPDNATTEGRSIHEQQPSPKTAAHETVKNAVEEPVSSEPLFVKPQTLKENKHVEVAFSNMELPEPDTENKADLLTTDDLLHTLVADHNPSSEQANEDKAQPLSAEEHIDLSEHKDLDMNHIINGMMDEGTKPAKLRSTKTGVEKAAVKIESNDQPAAQVQAKQVNEIADYDDVEFDKLLEEISSQTQDFEVPSNKVVNIKLAAQKKNSTAFLEKEPNRDFISVEELIEKSEGEEFDESEFASKALDVGLEEFPEFSADVNHVNVDEDKHGINAKLDLSQVYIEIGDFDNAAVILKSVMKLGNSSQQQQAQQLLYSLDR